MLYLVERKIEMVRVLEKALRQTMVRARRENAKWCGCPLAVMRKMP
jgi:hypothetical protein